MQQQRGTRLLIGVDHRPHHIRPHPLTHPRRRRRDQPLDVEFVRVDEEADQRHLVVGLVGDVGHDDDALFGDASTRAAIGLTASGACGAGRAIETAITTEKIGR